MAKRLLYSGAIIGARDAQACGLASAIVDGDVVQAAIEFAQPIAASVPLSLAASKLICDAIAADRVDEVRAQFDDLFRRARASEDCREGARAFAGKRTPRFTAR